MHTPRAFVETDLSALDLLFARDAFITLISQGDDGEQQVSHLPVLYRRDGEAVVLEGHWARANRQARHRGNALAIVHGPHAYVSPAWYPDKEPAARVPTWNYAVAHLHGQLDSFDDERALGELLSRLSAPFEASVGNEWQFDAERSEHQKMLRGIVGFRFAVSRTELSFKLSQNHPAANIAAVADALDRQPSQGQHEVAALMRRFGNLE